MTDDGDGWFAGLDPPDADGAASATAVPTGPATGRRWPSRRGSPTKADYYDHLLGAAVAATCEAVRDRERADDRQLVHAVRTMDDRRRFLLVRKFCRRR